MGVKDVPNDNGGKVKLSWNASYLEADPYDVVNYYNVFRSVPPNFAQRALARGARVRTPEEPEGATPGDLLGTSVEGRTYYWEFVASVTSNFLTNYSYLAPTAGDSTGYGNPRTAFMIQARTNSSLQHWESLPDSGYSVDNLPPLPPAPFTGQYSAGIAQLHWGANSESDLANYRLYRGTSSGFTPSLANRIAAPTDTAYSDAAGSTYYYKLSAIDIHGNESGYTTLLPVGALDAGPLPPRELALERPSPNPAVGRITLRYTLPRESSVSLLIFDPSGRVIRTLADGVTPAGDHQATWDLRDDAGHAVGAGLYFARLQAEGRSLVRRMTAMR